MRINFDHLIKPCATRTDSSTGITSIGCRLTRSCLCFCSVPRQFYRDKTDPAYLSGLFHLDSFIMTRKLSSIHLDCAKTNPTLTQTATNSTAGPLALTCSMTDSLSINPNSHASDFLFYQICLKQDSADLL
jgi:hypothetical protein